MGREKVGCVRVVFGKGDEVEWNGMIGGVLLTLP